MRSKKDNKPLKAGPRLDRLNNLVARIDSAKADADTARSDLGTIYKEAEDFGFHRRALKEAVRLKNMEPEKRNDYLRSLQTYCDELDIWAQGELFEDEARTPSPAPQADPVH